MVVSGGAGCRVKEGGPGTRPHNDDVTFVRFVRSSQFASPSPVILVSSTQVPPSVARYPSWSRPSVRNRRDSVGRFGITQRRHGSPTCRRKRPPRLYEDSLYTNAASVIDRARRNVCAGQGKPPGGHMRRCPPCVSRQASVPSSQRRVEEEHNHEGEGGLVKLRMEIAFWTRLTFPPPSTPTPLSLSLFVGAGS